MSRAEIARMILSAILWIGWYILAYLLHIPAWKACILGVSTSLMVIITNRFNFDDL